MAPIQLSWENFRTTTFIKGQQRVHRVASSPLIEIFGDGSNRRIGIWIDAPTDDPIPPSAGQLRAINARLIDRHGRRTIELSTSIATLFQQFYYLATAIAERMLAEGCQAAEAIDDELQYFGELLGSRQLLGIERQLGLVGELLFLERLIAARGHSAIKAWLGPTGDPHDFRIADAEYEVKTTLAARRVHTINGENQLVPSLGCALHLVSIMLGPAGESGGFSLAEKAQEVGAQLAATPYQMEYWQLLEGCGYASTDAVHYSRRFKLRRPFAAVRIDDAFPAITRHLIQSALGSVASRVEAVRYDLDIEGLEHEDGSPQYAAMLPH